MVGTVGMRGGGRQQAPRAQEAQEAWAEELGAWLRGLRAGYDRGALERRLEALEAHAGRRALAPRELAALLPVWLHLNLPISKWFTIGLCLVPMEVVDDQLVRRAVQWVLASLNNKVSISRTGFVLSWLTAMLDHDLVNKDVLNEFYDVFMMLFNLDRYAMYVTKLLYTLTKPHDVNRRCTLELLELLKIRNSPRGKGQILALLGLFKSYKPECVPENIPALSVHNIFQKINSTLLNRLNNAQSQRREKHSKLMWRNPFRMMVRQSKKPAQYLIPDVEFINMGSQLYSSEGSDKNYLHFEDSVSVLAYSLSHRMRRPAQLLSLLCNETGAVLLCLLPTPEHSFLSHDLQQQLNYCFCREDSNYSYMEKVDMLQKLAHFQQVTMQPVPVVSNFLAQYLCTWSGCEYFEEILRLLEWVSLGTFAQLYTDILCPLELLCCTLPHPLMRALMFKTFTRMYVNMAYLSTRTKYFFLNAEPDNNHEEMLSGLSHFIRDLCRKCLQAAPDSPHIHAACLYAFEGLAQAEFEYATPTLSLLPELAVGLSLATVSAHAFSTLARVILLERKVCRSLKKRINQNALQPKINLLSGFLSDLSNCLWTEDALSNRDGGVLINRLSQRSVQTLIKNFKDVDKCFGLGTHLALAPYTYMRFDSLDRSVNKEVWLENVIQPDFEELGKLISIFGKMTTA